jgi:hypothetical protein
MISARDNEILTRVGPDTPVGRTIRRYGCRSASAQLPEPDGRPLRVALLGEAFGAFRDSGGRVGLLDEFCMHRRAAGAGPSREQEDAVIAVSMNRKTPVRGIRSLRVGLCESCSRLSLPASVKGAHALARGNARGPGEFRGEPVAPCFVPD